MNDYRTNQLIIVVIMALILSSTGILYTTLNFIPLDMYQEECIDSHQIKDKVIDYGNYTYAGYTYHETTGEKVPFYRGEPVEWNYTTVCDRYALVRNATADGK